MDPLYQITFEGRSLQTKTAAFRRVGKPRYKRLNETKENAWNKMLSTTQDEEEKQYEHTEEQRLKIKQAALDRNIPFHKKNNYEKRTERHFKLI